MTFDPRSLEHLQELSRQLPQKLPKPSASNNKEHQISSKLHPIDTEENPQALFKELMNASPDGNVPSHLITRLKEVEAKQLNQSNNHYLNERTSTVPKTTKTTDSRGSKKETTEEFLYASFERFLLEDEEQTI